MTNPPSGADVSLLVMDCDGVMTDGSIFLDDHGVETKRFNVRDGFGIRLWMGMGFRVAIVTGRSGEALRRRAKELGIAEIVQDAKDKREAMKDLLARVHATPQETAFIGDDWPDLPAMEFAAYPIAVADADPRVKARAAFVTRAPGGHGAIREAVEHLLGTKGLLDEALTRYSGRPGCMGVG